MFRSRLNTLAAAGLVAVGLLVSAVPAHAAGAEQAGAAGAVAAAAAPAALSAEEEAGLLFMREEEKLAHDVYTVLYDEWGLRAFANISAAESRHAQAVIAILDRYGIADPAAGLGVGEFDNAGLQALYAELVAEGSSSLAAALAVGAKIEELDILDLQEHLTETDNAAILRVYTNLLRGSESHLRAFASTYERQTGDSYKPVLMDEADYSTVLAGQAGRGQGRGRGARK